MRNLYKRLGISKYASTADIEAAIGRTTDATLRADASAVLLQPARRDAYDRIHTTLGDLSRLRAAFGMTHTENGLDEATEDFPKCQPA